MYTLGTAAKAAGVSKSTVHRAIRTGKISARSKDGAGYEIDPSEFHRIFPLVAQKLAEPGSSQTGTALIALDPHILQFVRHGLGVHFGQAALEQEAALGPVLLRGRGCGDRQGPGLAH